MTQPSKTAPTGEHPDVSSAPGSAGRRMAPVALFIVTADPRLDGRVAEAIRIGAGVGSWGKVQVRLYLGGASVLALGEWVDELVDEDNYTRYLPIFREFDRPIYVEAGAPCLAGLGEATLPYQAVDAAGLAALCREAAMVLRF